MISDNCGYMCYYCGHEKIKNKCPKCNRSTFEKYWKIAGCVYDVIMYGKIHQKVHIKW